MKKQNNFGFTHSLLLPVLIAILAIGGVSYYVYTKNNGQKTLSSEDEQTTGTLQEPLPDTLLSVSKVKELVNTHKPGSSIVSIELEFKDEVLVYKVTLADGTTLFFDAQTGIRTTGNENEDVGDGESLPGNFTTSIDFVKARKIALAEKPGATVQKIELELEDGVVVFSVRFTDKSRVIINAASGKVITIKHPETEDRSSSSGGDDSNQNDDGRSDNRGGDSGSNSEEEDRSGSNSGSDNSGHNDNESDND